MTGLTANCGPACEWPESRWVRTPEQWLRFPVSDLNLTIEGFPSIEGPRTGQASRVLLPAIHPRPWNRPGKGVCIDPLVFFGQNDRRYWQLCFTTAAALRGRRGAKVEEKYKKNLTLRERRRGAITDYVLTTHLRDGGGVWEYVFSSDAGFNIVSDRFLLEQGQPRQTWHYTFRTEKGVLIPSEAEYNTYEDRTTKDSNRLPTQHHVFTLKTTRVNEAIDPAVFECSRWGSGAATGWLTRSRIGFWFSTARRSYPSSGAHSRLSACATRPSGASRPTT